MKNKATIFRAIIFASFIFSSCGNNPDNNQTQATEVKKAILQPEYLGVYHGIQPSYYIKNQYGDDMEIDGQKIALPSIDFKFLLREDGAVSLQQTSLEDNSQVYYDGAIKIISDGAEILKLECLLSNGKSSNPTYTLAINKSDKTASCRGRNEPEFKMEKK